MLKSTYTLDFFNFFLLLFHGSVITVFEVEKKSSFCSVFKKNKLQNCFHDFLVNFFASKLQLEQEILNFSEGLRVIGIKPDEKLALFADNSCRWLVADQGKQIS